MVYFAKAVGSVAIAGFLAFLMREMIPYSIHPDIFTIGLLY